MKREESFPSLALPAAFERLGFLSDAKQLHFFA
jgi:hypothetical protein